MKPYNVEIFDNQLKYVCNTLLDEIKFKQDYMDPEKNKLDLFDVVGRQGYFIHVQRDSEDYIGIITAFEEKKESLTTVTMSEIASLFDLDIMIDVDDFNYTYEEYIKKWIKALFVDGDTSMALPFNISVTSSTTEWSINYKVENEPDDDEPEPPIKVAFVNLFDDIILPAFTTHQIKIDYSVNLKTKKIDLVIGKNNNPSFKIESDMPNIIDKTITINYNKKQTNKVICYNEEDYNQSVTYYLHKDNTFDTLDNNRCLPVNYRLIKCKKETDKDDSGAEVVVKTFLEVAHEKASDLFDKNKYTNLIELKMLLDDELIQPTTLLVGQVVEVITSDGTIYNTILSGSEISKGTITLIFGTIRLSLTKYLKGRS